MVRRQSSSVLKKVRRVLLPLAALAVACESPVEAYPFPSDAIPFDAPAVYAEWWSLVEACTGQSGDLSAVSWYRSAEPSGLTYRGQRVGGLYFEDGHRILLARENMERGETVRHEMIHALAAPRGHPREVFSESCAHLQRCIGCGHKEADRGVAASAPEYTSSLLSVSIVAEPHPLSASAVDGWYRLVVSAHNPLSQDVWVSLPDEASFSWIEVGKFGSYAFTDETRWAFRAGETRRYTFDLRDTVGTYQFYGYFGWQRSDTITVQIVP